MICWQGIFVHILTVLSFTGAKFLSSSNELNQQYDFIVVGGELGGLHYLHRLTACLYAGGTAGNVLANRLSQDEGTSVLLIEAGGQYVISPELLAIYSIRFLGMTRLNEESRIYGQASLVPRTTGILPQLHKPLSTVELLVSPGALFWAEHRQSVRYTS